MTNDKENKMSLMGLLILTILVWCLVFMVCGCGLGGDLEEILESTEYLEELKQADDSSRVDRRTDILSRLGNEIEAAEYSVRVWLALTANNGSYTPQLQESQRHLNALKDIHTLIIQDEQLSVGEMDQQDTLIDSIVKKLQAASAKAQLGDNLGGMLGALTGLGGQSTQPPIPDEGGLTPGTVAKGAGGLGALWLLWSGYRKLKGTTEIVKEATSKAIDLGTKAAETAKVAAKTTSDGLRDFGSNMLSRFPAIPQQPPPPPTEQQEVNKDA
jgi:uncharacterized protein YfkK (UPF0435 family)